MNKEPVTLSVAELQRLVDAYPPLTRTQQQALAALAAQGAPDERERAAELLFKHNAARILYFVGLYAKDVDQRTTGKLNPRYSYMKRWRLHAPWSMTSDEVISACLEGFWRAVKSFDPMKGDFNQHVNLAMWRAIQATRVHEERRERVIEQAPPAPEVLEATCPAESDIERALAWEAFTRYLREHCPEYVDDVLAMLNGSRAPCPVILAKVRKRLKKHVPEADWAWLGEVLG